MIADLLTVLCVLFLLVAAFLASVPLGFLVLALACGGGALAFNDGEGLPWQRRS